MGQKVHPTGIRLGIVKKHTSTWYAGSDTYADKLYADLKVREYINKRLDKASISRIDIERPANTANVTIHTAAPVLLSAKKVKMLRGCVQRFPKKWAFLFTSISKKFESLIWMQNSLPIV